MSGGPSELEDECRESPEDKFLSRKRDYIDRLVCLESNDKGSVLSKNRWHECSVVTKTLSSAEGYNFEFCDRGSPEDLFYQIPEVLKQEIPYPLEYSSPSRQFGISASLSGRIQYLADVPFKNLEIYYCTTTTDGEFGPIMIGHTGVLECFVEKGFRYFRSLKCMFAEKRERHVPKKTSLMYLESLIMSDQERETYKVPVKLDLLSLAVLTLQLIPFIDHKTIGRGPPGFSLSATRLMFSIRDYYITEDLEERRSFYETKCSVTSLFAQNTEDYIWVRKIPLALEGKEVLFSCTKSNDYLERPFSGTLALRGCM